MTELSSPGRSVLFKAELSLITLPSNKLTWPCNISIFPGKYNQIAGFSMAMLVYRSVSPLLEIT